MNKLFIILSLLFIFSCDDDPTFIESVTEGCMDESACNYNSNADVDDGSCDYPEEDFDCEGLCTLDFDCLGECGGDATEDNCGTCDSDPTNDCTADCNGDFGGTAQLDECGVCDGDGPIENFDCDGNCTVDVDCSGVCNGDSVIDDCGVCNGGNADDLGCGCFEAGPSGCDDICGSTLENDCAGVCGGSSALDDCGVCDGGNADDLGCGCFEDAPSGCDNTCGSILEFDQCGVCDGDNSTCSGCTDSTACNYDDTATLDDGTCIPPNECSLCEECDLSAGTIYLTNDSELWYNVTETINGFQFDIYGVTITSISDGDAQNSGFEVIYENGSTFSRVLGYSTSGNTVTPGCGTLLSISYEGTVTDVTDIIFATTFGSHMSVNYYDCP